MQFPSAFQEAYQAVIELPLWLKVVLPLLGLLVRHFWPQTGALVDKFLALLGKSPPNQAPTENQGVLSLIEQLLARRTAAQANGDDACATECTARLHALLEMLK